MLIFVHLRYDALPLPNPDAKKPPHTNAPQILLGAEAVCIGLHTTHLYS